MSKLRAALRILVSLAVLALLLGGVPAALLYWGVWPISGVPTGEQLSDAPNALLTEDAILGVLTVALWVAWALLVVSLVAEVVAQVRGVTRPRISLGGPFERLAGFLVGSIVLSFASAGAAGAAPALSSPSAGALPPAEPGAPDGAGSVTPDTFSVALDFAAVVASSSEEADAAARDVDVADAVAPDAPVVETTGSDAPPTVIVDRGETAWSVAEAHLGDGARWRELWELNRHTTQPDGTQWSDADGALVPGWELVLPADATGSAAVVPIALGPGEGASPGRSAIEMTAEEGDHFWGLAKKGLASWGHEPTDAEMAAYWQDMRDDQDDRLGSPAELPGADVSPDWESLGGGSATEPAAASPPVAPVAAPGVTAAHAMVEVDMLATSSSFAVEESSSSSARPIGLVMGGLSVAGAVALLHRRRRAQLRRRGKGEQVRVPHGELQALERQLLEGADRDGAVLLDAALRAAAAGSGTRGLPPLRWVETGPQSVTLVLESAAPAPSGFEAVDAFRWQTRASAQELASIGSPAAAPAPTLVPIGAVSETTEALIELEAGGVVCLDGPEDDVLGLVRAMALAAATAPWSEQSRVLLVGVGGDLADLPTVSQVDLDEAIAAAEAQVAGTEAALRSLNCRTTAQARALGQRPEAWDPLVVISAVRPDHPDQARRLGELARTPRTAMGFVTLAPTTGARFGRSLLVSDDGSLRVDGVAEGLWPRYLEEQETDGVVGLMAHAGRRDEGAYEPLADRPDVRRPPQPAPSGSKDEPDRAGETMSNGAARGNGVDRPDRGPGAEALQPASGVGQLLSEVDVLVRVLGDVEAVRLDGETEEKLVPTRQKGLEAITYLALRETSVGREDLEINLFPDGTQKAKTVYNTISSARALVGDVLFPPPDSSRYALSDRVVTDYGLFCQLVTQADEKEDALEGARLLSDALSVVRGEPFLGVGRNYTWVGAHRGMIVAQVVDAAEELAEIRLATGDWRAAEWAARQGLKAFPADERMYRLLMRAAAAAGNVAGVRRVFNELCDVTADPDLGVEPEDTLHPDTVELLEALTRVAPASSTRPAPASSSSA